MINNRVTILLVEDDRTQQKLIKILCKNFGFAVLVVSTGEQAIAVLDTCHGCIDAVLMDWKLPDMDGLACTRKIRESEKSRECRVPIIACTACAIAGDREQCLAAGMDDYMSKPFTADQFATMLLQWTYKPSSSNLRILPDYRTEV